MGTDYCLPPFQERGGSYSNNRGIGPFKKRSLFPKKENLPANQRGRYEYCGGSKKKPIDD